MAKYISLMSSLPPLGKLFEASKQPISRLKLENRLRLLDDRDMENLTRMSRLIAWSEQPLDRTDQDFILEAERFVQQERNPTLKRLVSERIDLRTIITALRRRHRGETEPPAGKPWGFGQWVGLIERHWKEPAFHLDAIHPWVVEANRLLEANDLVAFERHQFSVVWNLLDQIGAGHYFDFEAVAIYLNRWSLMARWTVYDGDAAVERFRQLVDSGLEQFTDVFSAQSP